MGKTTIPCSRHPAPNAAPFPCFAAPSAKVLVVDDLAANIRLLKDLMGPCGVKTYVALNGTRAIEMMQKERYDIVFMDMMMPEMGGLETIARIRALGANDLADAESEYFREVPIVPVSANELDARDETFARFGVSNYMAKPIDVEKLFDILERLLPREKIIPTHAK